MTLRNLIERLGEDPAGTARVAADRVSAWWRDAPTGVRLGAVTAVSVVLLLGGGTVADGIADAVIRQPKVPDLDQLADAIETWGEACEGATLESTSGDAGQFHVFAGRPDGSTVRATWEWDEDLGWVQVLDVCPPLGEQRGWIPAG